MKKLLFGLCVLSGTMLFAENLLKDGDFSSNTFKYWTDQKWKPFWGTKVMKAGTLSLVNDQEREYTLSIQYTNLEAGKYRISYEMKYNFSASDRKQSEEQTADGKTVTVKYVRVYGLEIATTKTLLSGKYIRTSGTYNSDWQKNEKTFDITPEISGKGRVYLILRHLKGSLSFRNIVLEKIQ